MMTYITDLKGLGQVRRNPEYSDKEVRLLEIITDHCQYCLNTGKACELSYSQIKEWTGWASYSTVSKTIKSLAERGDITAETEQLKGRMKSTTTFTSAYVIESGTTKTVAGYYNNCSSGTTKTVAGGTTKTVGNNNIETIINNKEKEKKEMERISKKAGVPYDPNELNDNELLALRIINGEL